MKIRKGTGQMTLEEAADYLKQHLAQEDGYTETHLAAVRLAIAALEKRTPRQPIYKAGWPFCPVCGDQTSDSYCAVCGQALETEGGITDDRFEAVPVILS